MLAQQLDATNGLATGSGRFASAEAFWWETDIWLHPFPQHLDRGRVTRIQVSTYPIRAPDKLSNV